MIRIEIYKAHEEDKRDHIFYHTIKRVYFCGICVWRKAVADYTGFNPDGSVIQQVERPIGFQPSSCNLMRVGS